MKPTLILDATVEMRFCREASFAPVVAIIPVDNVSEAVEMDRRCPYALGASIFCRDPSEGEKLASRLDAGTICINDVLAPTAHPATPFGGQRDSGWGVTQGAEGLLEMTVPQVVSRRKGKFRPHYHLAAGSNVDQEEMLRGLMEMTQAGSWLRRWRGLWRMVRGFRKMWADQENDSTSERS